jgi:hypothetical protein
VEAPGTAPGSERLIPMPIYRHSRPRGRQRQYRGLEAPWEGASCGAKPQADVAPTQDQNGANPASMPTFNNSCPLPFLAFSRAWPTKTAPARPRPDMSLRQVHSAVDREIRIGKDRSTDSDSLKEIVAKAVGGGDRAVIPHRAGPASSPALQPRRTALDRVTHPLGTRVNTAPPSHYRRFVAAPRDALQESADQ